MSVHTDLVRLLEQRSAKHGHFTLASGRTSTLYIDARLTTMSPEGLILVASASHTAFQALAWEPDAVGGLTLGADPIAYAISYASAQSKNPIRAFTVRKEAKQHGTGKRIEGPFQRGDRVVVVEDVITTGGSALNAIEVVRAEGGEVLGVLALVDRQEGGREAIVAAGVSVHALVLASELQAPPG